jgi:hypothetical protein
MPGLEEITRTEADSLQEKRPNLFRRIYDYSKHHINYRFGLVGATGMGIWVYFQNYSHGFAKASVASLKQAAYTLFIGGYIMKGCEKLATKIKNPKLAYALSFLVPSVTTIALTYLVHTLKGTPETLKSTIPTVIVAPPSFAVFGYVTRKRMDKKKYTSSQTSQNL